MFELIETSLEAVSGYLISKFKVAGMLADHIGMMIVSFLFGLLFFISFGAYEIINPSKKSVQNIFIGLAVFSFAISFAVYLLLLVDKFFKDKKNKSSK
jgi:hypothetical protein